jgi:hypothetical protein
MASSDHDFIAALVARKVASLGFEVSTAALGKCVRLCHRVSLDTDQMSLVQSWTEATA